MKTKKLELTLEGIREIKEPTAPSTIGTDLDETAFEKHLAYQARLQPILDSEQDRRERKAYASKVFWLISFWICAVFLVLVFDGFGSYYGFKLSDGVLITLVGSTTASILGIFIIVVRYLFSKH